MVIEGLFTWREEDPRRRNNFSLGLHTEVSVRLLSLLAVITTFQQNYHNNKLMVTLNEMVSLYCCDYPLNGSPPFLSGLSLVLGSS